MPVNAITFNIQDGGLGRSIAGKDFYSGICFPFEDADLPAGFSALDRFKQIVNLAGADALGLLQGLMPGGIQQQWDRRPDRFGQILGAGVGLGGAYLGRPR